MDLGHGDLWDRENIRDMAFHVCMREGVDICFLLHAFSNRTSNCLFDFYQDPSPQRVTMFMSPLLGLQTISPPRPHVSCLEIHFLGSESETVLAPFSSHAV